MRGVDTTGASSIGIWGHGVRGVGLGVGGEEMESFLITKDLVLKVVLAKYKVSKRRARRGKKGRRGGMRGGGVDIMTAVFPRCSFIHRVTKRGIRLGVLLGPNRRARSCRPAPRSVVTVRGDSLFVCINNRGST